MKSYCDREPNVCLRFAYYSTKWFFTHWILKEKAVNICYYWWCLVPQFSHYILMFLIILILSTGRKKQHCFIFTQAFCKDCAHISIVLAFGYLNTYSLFLRMRTPHPCAHPTHVIWRNTSQSSEYYFTNLRNVLKLNGHLGTFAQSPKAIDIATFIFQVGPKPFIQIVLIDISLISQYDFFSRYGRR